VSVIPGSQSVRENEQNVAALEVRIPDVFWRDLKGLELLHPQAPTPGQS
jgi:aryl-alcohol dehydrogenase-like predicted oxidoreductase